MKQLEHRPTHVKINLTKLEEELNAPKVTALLNQGYIITATIPVDDEGTPTALCILTHPHSKNYGLTIRNIAIIAITAITLQSICLAALHFTLS